MTGRYVEDWQVRQHGYLKVVEGWLRNNRDMVFTPGMVDDLSYRVGSALIEASKAGDNK